MKKPPQDGMAISESLYADGNETNSKIATRPQNCNMYGRPSLTHGVEYPLSGKEEKLLDLAYNQGYQDAIRINRSGRLFEDDPLLDLMRQRVEEIRKKRIKQGRIEPVNKAERKWRLGL